MSGERISISYTCSLDRGVCVLELLRMVLGAEGDSGSTMRPQWCWVVRSYDSVSPESAMSCLAPPQCRLPRLFPGGL